MCGGSLETLNRFWTRLHNEWTLRWGKYFTRKFHSLATSSLTAKLWNNRRGGKKSNFWRRSSEQRKSPIKLSVRGASTINAVCGATMGGKLSVSFFQQQFKQPGMIYDTLAEENFYSFRASQHFPFPYSNDDFFFPCPSRDNLWDSKEWEIKKMSPSMYSWNAADTLVCELAYGSRIFKCVFFRMDEKNEITSGALCRDGCVRERFLLWHRRLHRLCTARFFYSYEQATSWFSACDAQECIWDANVKDGFFPLRRDGKKMKIMKCS